ncbi:MAG: multifunctional CCA addition/repair protein [Gammaproteobacteria bacterium]|nr:MAG: multifunctional CCA addition/repair protein [Gammaproteobacteria bacterium]
MQTFLVGGAVRDRLLGLTVRERDWVVVGATEAELEQLGYRRVGRSFPVFLHPETREEYAMARTETKHGPGYRGFDIEANPQVTLEDDLARRDLTINAIAEDADGKLIDPYHGRQDLDARVLRHVTDAFREDPVRILRVARFAARFAEQGFTVADETLALIRDMVAAGEADALVPERIWRETERALETTRPDIFFRVLRAGGALAVIYPEIDALFGVPQPERWHPEIDTGVHVLMALEQAARLGASLRARFAVMVHDLGKGTTPAAEWPHHRAHEERSVMLLEVLCKRIGVPGRCRELAIPVARYHGVCHRAAELRPKTLLKILDALDAFRRPERLDDFLIACEADARGRKGLEATPYPQADIFRAARAAAIEVTAERFVRDGIEGPAIGESIRRERITVIGKALRSG